MSRMLYRTPKKHVEFSSDSESTSPKKPKLSTSTKVSTRPGSPYPHSRGIQLESDDSSDAESELSMQITDVTNAVHASSSKDFPLTKISSEACSLSKPATEAENKENTLGSKAFPKCNYPRAYPKCIMNRRITAQYHRTAFGGSANIRGRLVIPLTSDSSDDSSDDMMDMHQFKKLKLDDDPDVI